MQGLHSSDFSGEAEKESKEDEGEASQKMGSAQPGPRGALVCYLHPRGGPILRHLPGGHCLWAT